MSTIARECSPGRILSAALTFLPLVLMGTLQYVAKPDLEIWLAIQTKGFSRQDAFNGVNGISTTFTVLLAVTSVLAMLLIVFHKSKFLLSLASGPMLAGLAYLVGYGFTDPAWFTLLALLSIGMLVSAPVTTAWVLLSHRSRLTSRSRSA